MDSTAVCILPPSRRHVPDTSSRYRSEGDAIRPYGRLLVRFQGRSLRHDG